MGVAPQIPLSSVATKTESVRDPCYSLIKQFRYKMPTRTQKYHQAALTYLVYGLLYLSGAVYLAEMDVVARSGWAWFLVGAVFVLVLPPLIWKEFKWLTRILALLVFVRIVGLGRTIAGAGGESVPLPFGGALPLEYGAAGFLLIAVVTDVMLIRAGWNLTLLRPARKEDNG